MFIIGSDYHPSFQQIAYVDTETGELDERRLVHPQEAEQFYGELKKRNGSPPHPRSTAQNLAGPANARTSVRARWLPFLPALLRTKRVRKQKTDRQDAQLLLRLLLEELFPRICARHSQPGHAATAVASASIGADAHAGDESVACGRSQ